MYLSRQLTLFGTRAKEKSKKYAIFKNPQGRYEQYVERYCLHKTKMNPGLAKKTLLADAQKAWKLISSDIAAQDQFLRLKDG